MDDLTLSTNSASSKLPNFLTTVTPLSKALAMLLFVTLPFLGFYLGMQYQKLLNTNQSTLSNSLKTKNNTNNSITSDGKVIPTSSLSPTLKLTKFEVIGNLRPEHLYKEPNINLTPSMGYVITTSRLSNDKTKVAYAEISSCIFDTSNNDCSFNLNLFIKDINQNSGKLIYSQKHSQGVADFMVYFPMGWSKNDKKLLIEYGNPTNIGMGRGPEYYWATLDVTTNKTDNLSSSTPEFIDNNLFAIITDTSSLSPSFCGPANGNSGKIIKKNVETGVSVVLLEQPNYYYANLSVVGTTLNYEKAPMSTTNDSLKCGDVDWNKPFEKGSSSL